MQALRAQAVRARTALSGRVGPLGERWRPFVSRMRSHPAALLGAGFMLMFAFGYLIAALVLFPAPIFAQTRMVPRLLDLERETAESRLTESGLVLGQADVESHPSSPRGRVTWQSPPPGVRVPEGSVVRITVSGGPQRVAVPDLVGYDIQAARALVEAAGLAVGRVDATQAPAPQGVVVSTRPPTGATLLPGGEVILMVSVGAPTITVPDLTGLTRDSAGAVLEEVGLTLGTSLRRTSTRGAPDTVIEQDPAPGTLSAPGTVVNIRIARRPSE
jgi:serine/threonine-protein kinase